MHVRAESRRSFLLSSANYPQTPFTTSQLEDVWSHYGNYSKLSVREKLVILTAIEISRVGVLEFNAKNPCKVLGAKFSIVNYYFGGRDGLLAEAANFVHEEWISAIRNSLSTKAVDPAKQLKKIVLADIAFAKKWGAMGTFASYPNSSPNIRQEYVSNYDQNSRAAMEYYLAVLAVLIHDARRGQKSIIDFTIDSVPKQKMKTHRSAFLAATSFAWASHGLVVWTAGQHAPTQNIEDRSVSSLTTQYAMRNHIKTIITTAIKGKA